MKVYELLDDESRWMKGADARDAHGVSTIPRSPVACCWCLYGAIEACYPNYEEVANKVREKIGSPSVVIWNDDQARTYEEVVALCKELDI